MKKNDYLFANFFALISLGSALTVNAAEEISNVKMAEKEDFSVTVLDKMMVIGDETNIKRMPGSAHVVSTEDIRQNSYDDINRVLRKVPGVYVREEDGFGLFPNISIRGVDTTRSAKVTVMEDGILMAPAAYSAPSAYYSPSVGRMSGVEILKGSSQIKYGPHITGGVVNYLSTPIPTEKKAYLKGVVGSFSGLDELELRTHGYVGNTFDTELGKFGVLLEAFVRKNDGFKTIDETADFRDGNDTGFTKIEPMVKLSWEPNTDIYQLLEFKYGYSDLDANETYLGLSETDFRSNPVRRYSASRFDNIQTEHERVSLRYTISPTDDLDFITTLYHNEFDRNWYKLKDIRNVNGNKLGLSSALAGAQNGEGLDCLKGDLACTLRVRANNRSYVSKGIQSTGYYRFGGDMVQHEVSIGIRYHRDEIRRFQWDDDYSQIENGTISDMTNGVPGEAGDRFQRTDAIALHAQDVIDIGSWTITPGIRYELMDHYYEEPGGTAKGNNNMDILAGGLGVAYQFDDFWTGFGGVHRGFSPPGPRAAIKSGLEEETSIAYEAGIRYGSQALSGELVGFFTDFQDLIVVDNIGGVGTGDSENFGEVFAYGAELAAQFDAGIANDWGFSNPWFVNTTYTRAIQQNDSRSEDAESIFSFGRDGNRMPYIPEWQVNFGTSIESENWGASISASYVSSVYTSASNVNNQLDGDGNPDARFGKTDNYIVADSSLFYRVTNTVKVFGGVQNLFDEEYVVSRQPHGPRPGMPRMVYIGFELDV